jgi:hypothetical protein
MELRNIVLQIGSDFAEARTQPLADDPLAGMMRSAVPTEFERTLGDSASIFKGAPSQGNSTQTRSS